MNTWQCIVCGYIYDEATGDPAHGIAAGTRWEDIPADWTCPECGVAKADFEMELLAAGGERQRRTHRGPAASAHAGAREDGMNVAKFD